MLTPAEAEKLIGENLLTFLREDCPLSLAHGRVLREDLVADRDLPPFDRVTMDGYALRSAALAGGTTLFRIEATQAAGMRAFTLGPGEDACVEVMTGAVLPEGADCVVPYEDTQRDGSIMKVVTLASAGPGSSVHRRGSDHRAGDVMVRAGTKLSGREIAVAAAVGSSTLVVSAQPRIAVVATGDELVEVDASVASHQIRRSNDHAIRAALISAGYTRVERFHLRDVRHEIEHRLWHIIAEHDVVLITGGVSKGKFDFLPSVLDAQGVKKIFHGVAQRPGKPFWFGVTLRRTPVFALPGNPVSAYTCLHRYVLPALAQASGLSSVAPRLAALTAAVTFKAALAYYLPVRLSSGPGAELLATPDASNTSGDFAGLIRTDGFVELPANQVEFAAGFVTTFRPWV
ncbi:MAG TPA: molybdopterin molybdotransferase MoeA [Opitutus sp.]|nr:molybdopterin molybdotransferase MoeA [Opitutus sp.]